MPAPRDNALHRNTPTVTVLDNRGLVARTIHYHRHPDRLPLTEARIIRQHHDAKGFMSRSSDPRMHASGRVNFNWLTDLAGNQVCTHSADAGVSINLGDAAGRPLLAVTRIAVAEQGGYDRSEAVTRTWHYESPHLPVACWASVSKSRAMRPAGWSAWSMPETVRRKRRTTWRANLAITITRPAC